MVDTRKKHTSIFQQFFNINFHDLKKKIKGSKSDELKDLLKVHHYKSLNHFLSKESFFHSFYNSFQGLSTRDPKKCKTKTLVLVIKRYFEHRLKLDYILTMHGFKRWKHFLEVEKDFKQEFERASYQKKMARSKYKRSINQFNISELTILVEDYLLNKRLINLLNKNGYLSIDDLIKKDTSFDKFFADEITKADPYNVKQLIDFLQSYFAQESVVRNHKQLFFATSLSTQLNNKNLNNPERTQSLKI